MKLYGISGKGSGKLGSTVYAISGGEQIVRQYNPVVNNPQTDAQVAQRSKLKLMSQLAATMAGQIAIPSQGMKSSRNLFIKKNIGKTTYSEGVANFPYEETQLTAGTIDLGSVGVTAGANSTIVIAMDADVSTAVDRMVYNMYKKTATEQLQLIKSVVVSEAGESGTFPYTMDATEEEIIVLAYGLKDKDAAATVKFENYQVETGVDVARLVTSRASGLASVTLTATSGATYPEITPWVNPYPEAVINFDGTDIGPVEQEVSGASEVDDVYIKNVPQNASITYKKNGAAQAENASWDGTQQAFDVIIQGVSNLPCQVFANGSLWFTLTA